ncbi:cell division protein FtsK [Bifidobacterium leontopitheci]|uniref:Cell division protein FtsK n=2 Tax=Bifidobacterium leontopitheci TaxID=2650774 RepID=A0A6I1GKV6_9BIFI|nr:FtsK/SpoIIIE domain-containing protein [Bifidobacterium leontopitheci]KAB7790089.1 cell division protein FtsK [Bifidobacterium leontopitheci]
MLSLGAPLAAQTVMLVAMLVERRWMFAVMIAPSLVGCLASMLAALQSQKPGAAAQDANDGLPHGSDGQAAASGAAADGRTAGDPSGLSAPSLEALHGLDRDPLLWRVVAPRWLAAPSMRAQVGVGVDGPFCIDLAAQGPHALVAGTTGSGKSVLLQSWCLAMALNNSPDALRFVFLDFKGGSAFSALERLPHAVGSVCDLDLKHAARALRALEAELTRRERLVAQERVSAIHELRRPQPRLVIVIDEFHALKNQLPDYIDRLVRIASLGRSLGMHLIACTQNPLGQVGSDMKANMTLNICLRVRDALQSAELLGDGRAAAISPNSPGGAWVADGQSVTAMRCSPSHDIDSLVSAIGAAAAFHGIDPAAPLFTPPLPSSFLLDAAASMRAAATTSPAGVAVPFALGDDGVGVAILALELMAGNIGVIGGHGRGKTTLLDTLAAMSRNLPGLSVRRSQRIGGEMVTERLHHDAAAARTFHSGSAAPTAPRTLWLVDDADALLDPFAADAHAAAFQQALGDPSTTVVFAVETSKHVRVPEHCTTRVVFPTGERTIDLMDGIPAELLATCDHDDIATSGRAVLLRQGAAMWMQCATVRKSPPNHRLLPP